MPTNSPKSSPALILKPAGLMGGRAGLLYIVPGVRFLVPEFSSPASPPQAQPSLFFALPGVQVLFRAPSCLPSVLVPHLGGFTFCFTGFHFLPLPKLGPGHLGFGALDEGRPPYL